MHVLIFLLLSLSFSLSFLVLIFHSISFYISLCSPFPFTSTSLFTTFSLQLKQNCIFISLDLFFLSLFSSAHLPLNFILHFSLLSFSFHIHFSFHHLCSAIETELYLYFIGPFVDALVIIVCPAYCRMSNGDLV